MNTFYDLIVVGAGPAGNTVARYASSQGISTLLIDKKSELGSPVQCSGAVSANALSESEIPFDDEFISEPIFGFITYSESGEAIRIDYRTLGREEPLGYVVDRKRFDRYLAKMASSAGATLSLKTAATGFERRGDRIKLKLEKFGEKFEVETKLLVGADGVMSQVGLWAGLHTAVPLKDLASCLQYYVEDVPTEGLLEIVTGKEHAPGGYAWVFPKGNGMAEIGLGVIKTLTDKDARWHLEKFMKESFLAPRFQNAKIIEIQGGGVPLAKALKTPYAANVLLVGDAARQVNPLTGGGIHTALRSAKIAGEFIADAFKRGCPFDESLLAQYHADWFSQLGAPLSSLYELKRSIFSRENEERQDEMLFQTLGNYFQPKSEYRKI